MRLEKLIALKRSLEEAFIWHESKQGAKYWHEVHDNILEMITIAEKEEKAKLDIIRKV